LKKIKPLFIVGNSRSGTKMTTEILRGSKEISCFPEMHFFEQYYSFEQTDQISLQEAINLSETLIVIRDNGYRGNIKITNEEREKSGKEAEEIVNDLKRDNLVSKSQLFIQVLASINTNVGYVCDPTPRNQFYVKEITEQLGDSKFIYLYRDPRDILLSQKKKWKARKGRFSNTDVIRTFINYHPFTISKLWVSSLNQLKKIENLENVHIIKYEDLVNQPEEFVQKMCLFLSIDFDPQMLNIHYSGSSRNSEEYSKVKGITNASVGSWITGLNSAEIFIAEYICGKTMKKLGYQKYNKLPNPIFLLLYLIYFPIHIAGALLFNFSRASNLLETIKKRFA